MAAWHPERVAELKRLFAEGLTWNKIGLQLGLSGSAARRKAYRLGLRKRQQAIIDVPDVLAMRKSGWTYQRIANAYDVTKMAIINALKRAKCYTRTYKKRKRH